MECFVTECSEPARAKRMCMKHYQRWRTHGDPLVVHGRWTNHVSAPESCEVQGCSNPRKYQNPPLCGKHMERYRRFGDPTASSTRGPGRPKNTLDMFWGSIDKGAPDKCWEWNGARSVDGYGVFPIDRKTWRAHRFALANATGEDPPDRHACHHCDNRPCCNPSHLYWGTAQENSDDAVRRGRTFKAKGPLNPHAIFTAEEERDITAAYLLAKADSQARGLTRLSPNAVRQIADEFGIHVGTVRRITARVRPM